jgi:hypothetical protein
MSWRLLGIWCNAFKVKNSWWRVSNWSWLRPVKIEGIHD